MSTAPPAAPAPVAPLKRYPLSLPPGSVRAIHVLAIVGLTCLVILLPPRTNDAGVSTPYPVPPYLIYLLFIMLGHYFAAHGVTINTRDDPAPSPLFLPGGTVRVAVILMLCGCVGWKVYSDLDGLRAQFALSLDQLKNQPYLPVAILGGFFVGIVISSIVRHIHKPAWWQDIEAWISLVALIGIAISALIHLVVERYSENPIPVPTFNAIVGGIVAFYFGERS
ncbi:MAG TPA: hypothetical protein VFE62_06720 [Gemmataceae bacterium]|nr:hypothetical protein [Gemmataceae bacterium]